MVNHTSLDELVQKLYDLKRVVQNFNQDTNGDLEDTFEDRDYCPKEDSGHEDQLKYKKCDITYKFRISLDHHMKTKHVGNWSCNLCEYRRFYSKLLNGHYDENHSDWEKENTRSRLSRCEPTIEE